MVASKKPTNAKKRKAIAVVPDRASDPRGVEILAAFDYFSSSRHRDAAFPSNLMESVFGFAWTEWPDAAQRAVAVAYLANAPSDDVDDMLAQTRKEMKWLKDYESNLDDELLRGIPHGITLALPKAA